MPPEVMEWSNLVLRWFHVFAAMLWVGQTYYFTKLARLYAGGASGDSPVWMAASGTVYVAERRSSQALLPARAIAVRAEALATWVSGFLLLGMLYYSDGLLLNDRATIGMGAAVGIGIAVLLVGWAVYDLLWISPLGRSPLLAGVVSYAALVGLTYWLVRIFSGRAAYIHLGSLLGTILTLNVLMRIFPAQRKLLAAEAQGQPADPALLERIKSRSRHNLLLVVPVVFLMLSNHFPLIYGAGNNWLLLSTLVLVGGVAGKILFGI